MPYSDFGTLNMAIINSYVIYVHNTINNNKKLKYRRSYVKEVPSKLCDANFDAVPKKENWRSTRRVDCSE